MKLHIKDTIWLIVLISFGLTWWRDKQNLGKAVNSLKTELRAAERREKLQNVQLELAVNEADVLSEEVRRLQGLIKSSLADQREWFELEVNRNELVAIRPGTSGTNVLTMHTVEKIESETGLEAKRLRHFLTPISELQLGRE